MEVKSGTIPEEYIKTEAVRFTKDERSPSPCPCKSKECMAYHQQLLDTIATIKTKYEPKATIIGVSGMGHISAQAHVKSERKDEIKVMDYLRPTNLLSQFGPARGGAGGRSPF